MNNIIMSIKLVACEPIIVVSSAESRRPDKTRHSAKEWWELGDNLGERGEIIYESDDDADIDDIDDDIDLDGVDIDDIDLDEINDRANERRQDHRRRHQSPSPPIEKIPLNTPAEKTDFFWNRVADVGWQNGGGQQNRVPKSFFGRNVDEIAALTEIYSQVFDAAYNIIAADGLFGRYKMSRYDEARLVSHIIALGRDSYENLIGEMSLVDYLWASGDCQSFDEQLSGMSKMW